MKKVPFSMVNQLDFCSKTSFFIQKCPFSLFSTSISLYLFAKLYLLTFYPGQICNSTLCNNSNASSLTLLNNNLYVRPLPTRTAIIMDWSGRRAFKYWRAEVNSGRLDECVPGGPHVRRLLTVL